MKTYFLYILIFYVHIHPISIQAKGRKENVKISNHQTDCNWKKKKKSSFFGVFKSGGKYEK